MNNKIRIGIASEEQVNQEFIEAWQRAERGELTATEERLYFLAPETFLQILSSNRLAILYALRAEGPVSIQTLSKVLERKYEHVYQDVQLLKKAGLIQETTGENMFVPWDKIQAELDLSSAAPLDKHNGRMSLGDVR